MRVRYLSDLHFEFQRDGGRSLVDSLPTDCDVLVLAGDIGVAHGGSLLRGMQLLLERFAEIPVLFVPGNHEFYGSGAPRHFDDEERARRKGQEKVRDVCDRLASHANFVGGVDPWLWRHRGVGFIGATMWFGAPPVSAPTHLMSDYEVIPGFGSWCTRESRAHLSFLAKHVNARSVVVTHHLPHQAAVAPRFHGHPLTPFFLHPDAAALIRDARPVAWIHGHSHEVLRERVGETLLLRNPFGYAPRDLVADFSPDATLEVVSG